MQQLARKKVYVFYSSVADRNAARCSVIADSIAKYPAPEGATVFFAELLSLVTALFSTPDSSWKIVRLPLEYVCIFLRSI